MQKSILQTNKILMLNLNVSSTEKDRTIPNNIVSGQFSLQKRASEAHNASQVHTVVTKTTIVVKAKPTYNVAIILCYAQSSVTTINSIKARPRHIPTSAPKACQKQCIHKLITLSSSSSLSSTYVLLRAILGASLFPDFQT